MILRPNTHNLSLNRVMKYLNKLNYKEPKFLKNPRRNLLTKSKRVSNNLLENLNFLFYLIQIVHRNSKVNNISVNLTIKRPYKVCSLTKSLIK